LGNNNRQKGRIGELFVCYILEKFGYQTAFVDTQGYDVIVNYKSRPIRIQVKSALSRDYNRKKGGKPRYNFATNIGGEKRKYTKEDADIIALFGSDHETVIFKLVDEIKTKTHKLSEAHFYDKSIMKQSFERCLESCSV
tara:strand:- start:172 stop:588 length:417 start_codon:yes stop_codon:yes gene_type:complete